MFNNKEYRESSIKHRVSSIENPSSFLCFLLKVGCSTFYVGRLSSVLMPLHLSRELYKSTLFMQNEPNFKIALINTSACNITGYDNFSIFCHPKNEPKRTQNEPNFGPKLGSFFQNWLCYLLIFQIEIVREGDRIPAYRDFLKRIGL